CALFQKASQLPQRYFDREPLGRILTRITADVEGVEKLLSETFGRLVVAIIQLVTVVIALVLLDPFFGTLVLLSGVPALAAIISGRVPVRYWLRVLKMRHARIHSFLAESFINAHLIKLQGLTNWAQTRFSRWSGKHYQNSIRIM